MNSSIAPSQATHGLSRRVFLLAGGAAIGGTCGVGRTQVPRRPIRIRRLVEHAPWSPRHGHTVVSFKGRLWLFAGAENERRQISRDVWSSPDGIRWNLQTTTAPWPARYLHQTQVFDNKIWLFGGMHHYRPRPKIDLNDVWQSYDGLHWTQLTPAAPWPARHVFASAVHRDRLWIAGGATTGKQFSDVWSTADGVGWINATADAPWNMRKDLTLISFQGKLWVLGGVVSGRSKNRGAINDIWSSPNGRRWTRYPDPPWSARDLHAAVVWKDEIWLIGGSDGPQRSRLVHDVWRSADGVNWNKHDEDAPWTPRNSTVPVIFKEQLVILGGAGAPSAPRAAARKFNDVWIMER